MRRIVSFLFAATCAWICTCQVAIAQQPPPTLGHATDELRSILKDWEKSRNVNLDPRAADIIAGEVDHFRSVAMMDYSVDPPARNAKTARLFGDRARLSAVLFTYLDNASKPGPLSTLLNQLCREIGAEAQALGWPNELYSNYQLVDQSAGLPVATFTLVADGLADSEPMTARKFLVLPGTIEIRSVGDPSEVWNFRVEAKAVPKGFEPPRPLNLPGSRAEIVR